MTAVEIPTTFQLLPVATRKSVSVRGSTNILLNECITLNRHAIRCFVIIMTGKTFHRGDPS